jgi:hypothetical protein
VNNALRNQALTEEQLAKLPKGHAFKLKTAKQFREETTVTVDGIAQRLSMGHTGSPGPADQPQRES